MSRCLIGDESGAGGASGGGLATGDCLAGGKMGKARLGGAFASAAPACGVGRVEVKEAMSAAIPPALTQNNILMIRISFDTQSDSQDIKHPEAWRTESAARLREIAKRIAAGEAMPLNLLDRAGNIIGKARELSYRPEPPRQLPTKPPPFIGGEKHSFSET